MIRQFPHVVPDTSGGGAPRNVPPALDLWHDEVTSRSVRGWRFALRSIRTRLLAAMLFCALIALVGSLVALSGFSRLERQTTIITRAAWPTADACMELWIATLSKDRARRVVADGDPRLAQEQLEWARTLAAHTLNEFRRAGEMSPETIEHLAELDRAVDRRVEEAIAMTKRHQRLRHLAETGRSTPEQLAELGRAVPERRELERVMNQTIREIEAVLRPEEMRRDAVMDEAGVKIESIVRRWRIYLALVVVAAVLGSTSLALIMSERLTRPLKRLVDLTHRLGRGEEVGSAGTYAESEVDELARSFDEMTARLATSRQQLVDSEASYRTLFEHARHGLVVIDGRGQILEGNRALCQLLDLDRERLTGRTLLDLLHLDEAARTPHSLERLLSQPEPIDLLFNCGQEKVSLQATGVSLPDGRRVVILLDLREQRRIENALIQNEKLSAVGQLAAGVAHELRNPLFVISNVIYGLREVVTSDEEGVQESLDIADEENRRARKIIDNLLEFSRPTAPGVVTIQPAPMIQQIATLFRKALETNKIELKLEVGATRACQFDPDGFKQVMVNLISNAIDSMPAGGRLIVGTDDAGHGPVRIRVSDTGGGIPAELRREIFNPFFSTKMPGKGTGLGLWIVHSTVARHHGEIDVQSTAGDGTTFTLLLNAVSELSA